MATSLDAGYPARLWFCCYGSIRSWCASILLTIHWYESSVYKQEKSVMAASETKVGGQRLPLYR
ncbi:hypothetical protein F9W95_05025 [Pectobacterium carotovorum]|nr:hypothetical protein [Pectobacterium atrosepticum]TAI91835.1 hypothetical protein EG331_04535 [Pectobacterium versatile]ULS45005.1 hypothetical protein F9W95_05025 [Pectobacterium carotovorum]